MPGSGPSRSASAAGWAAAALSGAAFVQTAWFDVFLGFGHIMNILVGVCLVALLVAALEPQEVAPGIGPLIAASAVAVTANAWQILLPVAAFGALPWFVASSAQLGGVQARRGHVARRCGARGQRTAHRHVTWTWPPRPRSPRSPGSSPPSGGGGWHGVLALSSVVACLPLGSPDVVRGGPWAAVSGASLSRRPCRWPPGPHWELMLYYPVKTLWTAIVVVIPLAAISVVSLSLAVMATVAGLRATRTGCLVRERPGRRRRPGVRGCPRSGGRRPARTSRRSADASTLMPNWSMAVEESMDATTSRAMCSRPA